MKRLKLRIYFENLTYVDFETNSFHFQGLLEDSKKKDWISLNLEERKILKCLCEHYNQVITIKDIFKFINEREFDVNNDDMHHLSVVISKLRKKITQDGKSSSESYIKSPRKGEYILELSESPFEELTDICLSGTDLVGSMSALEFFTENLSLDIMGVDFAFHTGAIWKVKKDYFQILSNLTKRKIPCRIIVNQSRYWCKVNEEDSGMLVRVSNLPLMRCYYHIRTKDESKNIMRICYYTYGTDYNDNYVQILKNNSAYYQLYEQEFSYLWNNSEPLDN